MTTTTVSHSHRSIYHDHQLSIRQRLKTIVLHRCKRPLFLLTLLIFLIVTSFIGSNRFDYFARYGIYFGDDILLGKYLHSDHNLSKLNLSYSGVAPVGSSRLAPLVGPIIFPVSQQTLKQQRVAGAMRWAWKGYADYAFGSDVLNTLELKGQSWNNHNMALTMVDSLDSLYIMGMHKEFNESLAWIESNLLSRFDQDVSVNVFEVNIRVLGGLLSAYHLSGRRILLDAAEDIGRRLLQAFSPEYGIPYRHVNLKTGEHSDEDAFTSLADCGSLQLEFKYLSKLTGKKIYSEKVEKVMNKLLTMENIDGLIPIDIDIHQNRATGMIGVGSNGDSYYEYLLKQWLLAKNTDAKYRDLYAKAADGIMKHLIYRSFPKNWTFVTKMNSNTRRPFHEMHHLTCFVPGMLALGVVNGMPPEHLVVAEEIMATCYHMYAQEKTGLAPEIVRLNTYPTSGVDDMEVRRKDAVYHQRPETLESLMILYRVTKKNKYREWGWKIFQSLETIAKNAIAGYDVIDTETGRPAGEFMESFFLAETLKYLFLLFADDTATFLPLDKYVFNTEAHPFPAFESILATKKDNPIQKQKINNSRSNDSLKTRSKHPKVV